MPDEPSLPILPTDATPSWFARNRKIVILGGLVLVLAVLAVFSFFWRSQATTNTIVNKAATVNATNTGSDTQSDRTTFQRSTVSTTPGAPVKAYAPPTTQDLQQAIQQRQATK